MDRRASLAGFMGLNRKREVPGMLRACPEERHASSYRPRWNEGQRCQGLVPWSVTLAATDRGEVSDRDATGLSRGVSRCAPDCHYHECRSKREAPRGKPVAS